MQGASDSRSERKRPATTNRRVKKQVDVTKKKELAKKENQAKNKIRVQKGKAQKADPGSEFKPSIWERMAEDSTYQMLREIGDTTAAIDKFQKKRVLMSVLLLLLGIPAGFFIHEYLYLAGPVVGFVFYKMKAKSISNYYRAWKFERQLNFSKFTRLVIPYLKASGGTAALYTIFNKILKRTENEADRRSLYRLMGEMGDNPADIQPFLDYADRSSGTDMSHLFMSTIFDFQQSTFDTQVIDELGKLAGEDMMNSIDEIIGMKLKRFTMFPTKIVMCSFILVAGLGAGLMLDSFKNLDMGAVSINPMEQASGAESETPPVDDTTAVIADGEGNDSGIWTPRVESIAADGSLDNEAKWQEMSRYAGTFEASDAEIEAFTSDLRTEFSSGAYMSDLENHAYTLTQAFKAQVLKEHFDGETDNPRYMLGLAMWTNSYYVYVEGDDSNVAANDAKVEAILSQLDA